MYECHEYEGVRWESFLGFNKPFVRHHQIARAHVLPGGGPGELTPEIPCKVEVFGRCPDINFLDSSSVFWVP